MAGLTHTIVNMHKTNRKLKEELVSNYIALICEIRDLLMRTNFESCTNNEEWKMAFTYNIGKIWE